MPDARPNFFDFDVTKMFADLRFHPFDVEAVWAAQRRNIEAFSQANQAAVAGVQALVKQVMENGVKHGGEIATIAAKAGSEAAEILHKRTNEGLDEFRAFASPKK